MAKINQKFPFGEFSLNCLTAMFLETVTLDPEGVAAVHMGVELRRVDLQRRAFNMVGHLDAVAPRHATIGIFAYPGFDILIGLWGTLIAGRAYCPLSPDYPVERLRYMIEAAGIDTIICGEGLEGQLQKIIGRGVHVLTTQVTDTPGDPDPPLIPYNPNGLAYVIFTSGSTGRPKGVQIENSQISHQLHWLHETFDLGARTRILQKTPFSFDAAQWELLASAFGATLIFGSAEGYRNPFEQIRLIKAHDVTMLQCVPTLWRALLETEQLSQCTTLTHLFSGGEALSSELARDCLAALRGSVLTNLYGPTETTINATYYTVTPESLQSGRATVPIGFPVSGIEIVIADENGFPVHKGASGEIFIGGPQVGRGYLNNPEATAERFVLRGAPASKRYYRTGDIGMINAEGAVQFMCRADGQVKFRGYRVELEEIRAAIENHDWVKTADVFVEPASGGRGDTLIACVELSQNQAQLMDAGAPDDHHKSKSSKLQVKAQLAQLGLRNDAELAGLEVLDLPAGEGSPAQWDMAFRRKTYRHFDGRKPVSKEDLIDLIAEASAPAPSCINRKYVSLAELGRMMRSLGQFNSSERLLPKYAYASPGALYAVQIYISSLGAPDLPDGNYYFHPGRHELYRIGDVGPGLEAGMALHFIGKSRAITPVYKLNVREVLDFEVGHILGLLDTVLPESGMAVGASLNECTIPALVGYDDGDYYLGGVSLTAPSEDALWASGLRYFVQSHEQRIPGLAVGMHELVAGEFVPITPEEIAQSHVIAINQQVYARSSFCVGICAVGKEDSHAYQTLGRALQRMQMNDVGIGLMSSGYSSASGEDQRAAQRFFDLIGRRLGAFYFCVGGRVSISQVNHRGMNEDMVHSRGPLELIRDDLKARLPDYMIPSQIVLLDRIPLSANGKVDNNSLRQLVDLSSISRKREIVTPRTAAEHEVARHWAAVTGQEQVSVVESFFDAGGDSLGAVKLVMLLSEAFNIEVPFEAIFETPTVESLARRLMAGDRQISQRLVRLTEGEGRPIYIWPGLGGYPLGLRDLAIQLSSLNRPIYGVQAYGLNAGQEVDPTAASMASRDVQDILEAQNQGPYTLLGYSFGSRVAFEAARLLETSGRTVDSLILVAPGNPILHQAPTIRSCSVPTFSDPSYVAVLISVFTRQMGGPELIDCLSSVQNVDDFCDFAESLSRGMPKEIARRIARMSITCLNDARSSDPTSGPAIKAPISVLQASGDDPSFLEGKCGSSKWLPHFHILPCDHFRLLLPESVDMLARHISAHLTLSLHFGTMANDARP